MYHRLELTEEQRLETGKLQDLLRRYYRYRFDPECDLKKEQLKLTAEVEQWLVTVHTQKKE